MTAPQKPKIKDHYIGRVNNAIEFIDNNLDKKLDLAMISRVAFYSPFHFHRIFSAVTNESLNAYINRRRIEKAASELMKNKAVSISELAVKSGFGANASFTKAFKKFYGISPSVLKNNTDAFSKIRQIDSKNGKARLSIGTYICNIDNYKKWITMNAKIEVRNMPAIDVAYVTHVGPFQEIGNAYGKLMRWAGPKGLIGGKTITVYHDDPNITDISKVRQSACIELKQPAKASGEVNTTTIKEGNYAVGKFEIAFSEFERSWQSMMVWINEKGYETNPENAYYEIYHNDFNTHPEKKCIVEICVPVN